MGITQRRGIGGHQSRKILAPERPVIGTPRAREICRQYHGPDAQRGLLRQGPTHLPEKLFRGRVGDKGEEVASPRQAQAANARSAAIAEPFSFAPGKSYMSVVVRANYQD